MKRNEIKREIKGKERRRTKITLNLFEKQSYVMQQWQHRNHKKQLKNIKQNDIGSSSSSNNGNNNNSNNNINNKNKYLLIFFPHTAYFPHSVEWTVYDMIC